MKQIAILLLIPLMLLSCNSDDDSSSSSLTTAFITINRNGQLFTQDALFGSSGMQNCSASGFELKATLVINNIANSEFYFTPGIISPLLKSDIDNNLEVATNIDILGERFADADCGLLYQFFPQYGEEGNFTIMLDDTADNINNIVEISMISETETDARYAIRGNYNVTYRDDLNYSINIYGEYVFHVKALK